MRINQFFIVVLIVFTNSIFGAITPISLQDGIEAVQYQGINFKSDNLTPNNSGVIWKVLGQPPGMKIDEKGNYFGTPTKSGNFQVNVLVYTTDKGRLNLKDSINISHTINSTNSPTINAPFNLPSGQYDTVYGAKVRLTATGGTPFPSINSNSVYRWMEIKTIPIESNEFKNLPIGLTLKETGDIVGVPSTKAPYASSNQTYTFKAMATDFLGKTASANFTLVINRAMPPVNLSVCPLPKGLQATQYNNHKLSATGGKPPYSWTIFPTQNFPKDLKLDRLTGIISGKPALTGNFSFQIVVTDANGLSDNKSCSITIDPVPKILTTSILDCVSEGSTKCSEIEALGGQTPYSWEIVNPISGMTIKSISSTKAQICGTFPSSGNFTILVKVKEKSGLSTTKSFSFQVYSALKITTINPLKTGKEGETYTDCFTATGGKPPYTWQILPQIYVSDFYNQRIRKFTENGSVTTYAGNGVAASINGNLTTSSFSYPYGLGFDPNGNIYVADSVSSKIRKISSSGNVTTLAPSFLTGTNVGFATPEDMVVDSIGNTYVSCTNTNDVKKIDPSGIVSVLASASAGIKHPQGICWDLDGDILLANMGTHQILKITTLGSVSLVGGSGVEGSLNGNAAAATFNGIHDLKVDFEGNVYVDDYSNKMIRKISMDGSVSTLANLSFNPFCLSVDSQGYVYVTNAGENKIMKVSPQGIVTHIAGSGKTTPIQNGPVLSATFNSPHSVDINPYEDLPFGLTLDATTGQITGKTKHNGLYNLTYRVTDSCGNSAISNCTLTIESKKPDLNFELPWKYTDQGAIAFGHNGSLRNYTSNTMPAGSLWQASADNLTQKVIWENSSNCPGGTNSNTQIATATINMTTTKSQKIGLSWFGIGEMQASDFEKMQVYINGTLIGSAKATGGNKNCEMGPVTSVNNYPNGFSLPAGNHTISINATTNDGLYHTGSYYQFSFTLVD
jgi:sugar lactone lactonase YvrE